MLTSATAGSREVRFGHPGRLAAKGLKIAAVRGDVLSHRRGDTGEILVENAVSVYAKPGGDAVDANCVPNEHGILSEAEATRLVQPPSTRAMTLRIMLDAFLYLPGIVEATATS